MKRRESLEERERLHEGWVEAEKEKILKIKKDTRGGFNKINKRARNILKRGSEKRAEKSSSTTHWLIIH